VTHSQKGAIIYFHHRKILTCVAWTSHNLLIYVVERTKTKNFAKNLIRLFNEMIDDKWKIILLTSKANIRSTKYEKVKKDYLHLPSKS
jgi:hypothetical protein